MMLSSFILLVASAFSFMVLSAPTPGIVGFSVPRVPTGRTNTAAAALYRTMQEYNDQRPDGSPKTAPDKGSVDATPEQYDSEYLCPVIIGSNQLNLDFDTGSSDLWVFSTLLPNSQNTSSNGHTLYNTTSGTLSPNQTWSILYGDGTGAEGIVYADKIIVGGATVTSQAVEAATSIASQFISQAGDGFLGLGFEDGNTCSPDQCETFFGNLMKSSPEPLFTADLQPDGGSYDFGYIDKSKYVGEIAYVDVLHESPAYWDFTAGIYSVGGKSGSIGDSIMDTGTSIWYLPEDATNDFYGSFNSSYDENEGAYVYSCDETPPDFSVEIGNTTFVVPGSAINFGPVGDGTENCIGGIQYSDLLPGSIFGDMFMKNFFVVFNQGTEQIGVAKQE